MKRSPTKSRSASPSKSRSVSPEKFLETNELFQKNVSPERQAMYKQIGGRIIVENEVKLTQVLQENKKLKQQLKKKIQEKERMLYKYNKH